MTDFEKILAGITFVLIVIFLAVVGFFSYRDNKRDNEIIRQIQRDNDDLCDCSCSISCDKYCRTKKSFNQKHGFE